LAADSVTVAGDRTASATAFGVDRPPWSRAHTYETGIDAELVGFTWDELQPASFRVRGWLDGGWTEWLTIESSLQDVPDAGSEPTRNGFAGPGWLGHDVTRVQLRISGGPVSDLRMHAIDSEDHTSEGTFGLGMAGAAIPQPPIVPRSHWGADETWRFVNCDGQPRYASDVRFSVVHHTATSNAYGPGDSAAIIRGIYHFHVFGNGWCDIGYNFLVDRYGQVFEGRYGGIDRPVIGGHAGGFNTGSTGVSVLGDFTSAAVPGATYSSLRWLLAWKLAKHGVDPVWTAVTTAGDSPTARWPLGTVVTLPTMVGHRDSNVTGCPGQRLYDLLPQLRLDVAGDVVTGVADEVVLSCDWNGDGFDSQGIYVNGWWYLRNELDDGPPAAVIHYGAPGFTPVCGDWDGDGDDTIGVYAAGRWILRNTNYPGPGDYSFDYGGPGLLPVVGDWDNDIDPSRPKGSETVGVYADGWWLLRNSHSPGHPNIVVHYGAPGFAPMAGDWNGDGRDSIGVFVGGTWLLRNSNTSGPGDHFFSYGGPGMTPLVGDWDADGDQTVGVNFRFHWWLRTINSSGPVEWAFDWASGS
jgi:hypothetical protein